MKKIVLLLVLIINVIFMFSCEENEDSRPYSFYYFELDSNSTITSGTSYTFDNHSKYNEFKSENKNDFRDIYYPPDFFNSYSLYVFVIEATTYDYFLHLEVEDFYRSETVYHVSLNEYHFVESSLPNLYLVVFEIKKLDKKIEDKLTDALLENEELELTLDFTTEVKEFDENPYFIFYLPSDSIDFEDKAVFSTYSTLQNSTLLKDEVKEKLPFDNDFFKDKGFVIIKREFTSSSIGYHMHEYKLVSSEKSDTTLKIKFTKTASIINRNLGKYDTYLVFVFKRGITNLSYDIIDV